MASTGTPTRARGSKRSASDRSCVIDLPAKRGPVATKESVNSNPSMEVRCTKLTSVFVAAQSASSIGPADTNQQAQPPNSTSYWAASTFAFGY